jgi:hypothetical protein
MDGSRVDRSDRGPFVVAPLADGQKEGSMTRTFTPDPTALYLGDNGECLCGAHLGMTATYSGRGISGQPLLKVTPRMLSDERMDSFRCEHPRCAVVVTASAIICV